MISGIMFFLGGVALGLALWSGVIGVSPHYTPIYYLCGLVSVGLGISLRRWDL